MGRFVAAILYLTAHTLIWLAYAGLPVWASAADLALDRIEKQVAAHQITQAAISELAEIISSDQKNYRAHIIMGNCCDYLGLPDQAVSQYRLGFKYGPNQPKACLNLIKALAERGQSAAARTLLEQAKQKFPADPYVLLLVGNASFREGKYAEAEAFYQEAIQEAKEPILGMSTALGTLRLKDGNYIAAINLAKKDLNIAPDFPPANEIAGLALMKTGQFEQAMPSLKIAFENSSPSFSLAFDYTQSLIWCGKYSDALISGLCSLATADNQQQRTMVLKAMKRINFHLARQDVEKAVQEFNRYRVISNSPIAHSEMAKICLEKGLTNLAVSQSILASQLAPQSAEAKYELALILEAYEHDYLTALKYLRQAHALAANDNQIDQHLMRLEDRLTVRDTDWSWQFKNWIGGLPDKK